MDSPSYHLENIVLTCNITPIDDANRIDLVKLVTAHNEFEYNPERFPGVIIRIPQPKCTVLLFSTGKCVITGVRAFAEIDSIIKALEKIMLPFLKKSYPAVKTFNFASKVENVVATIQLNQFVDLNLGAVILENSMYEPEVFPGLIYRANTETITAVYLIFSTGKMVCTKCKTEDQIKLAMNHIDQKLKELGLVREKMSELEDETEEEEMQFI